jgi:endonuclease G
MHDVEAAQRDQEEAAARRVSDATESRRSRIAELRDADAPKRKIIGTEDFLGVSYLEAGAGAARAIGRVVIREDGKVVGFGTGSLVSPALLLTNHHVLPSADVASGSAVEFRFQDGLDGQPLEPQPFDLDPDRFFLADDGLDFALVAVDATADQLADFGFNSLTDDEGEGIVGEFVTIVQHPRGKKKQIALRENRIVDVLDSFLHYEADTEPGSSGSPVFDDLWRVISLHHASVRAPDRTELGGFVNEGIRAKSLRAFIGEQTFSADEQALVDELLA